MGRQVNFYQHPDDLRRFEEMLRLKSNLRIFRHKWATPTPEEAEDLVSTLPKSEMPRDDRIVLVAREEDVAALCIHYRDSLRYWTIDIRASPVIEFSRSYVDGTMMTPGRLYFVANGKTPEFLQFAESILRWVRQRYGRGHGPGFQPRVSPEAARWKATGGGLFTPL